MAESSSGGMNRDFDAMLARDRSEFDKLYRVPDSYVRHPSPAPSPPLSGRSPAAAGEAEDMLNRRFGNDWRFDIVERRREGDELVVIGRVSIPSRNISVTQSANIPLPRAGVQSGQIAGSADGIAFMAGLNDTDQTRRAGESDEETALQQAIDEVIRSCMRWF